MLCLNRLKPLSHTSKSLASIKCMSQASFLIALIVYSITVEDTASFWDAGEFIAVSNKLEVPHPPGAPFYLLLGRFFSLFAFNNPELVALSINFLSVVASAFTILFLFWTITHLSSKIINKYENFNLVSNNESKYLINYMNNKFIICNKLEYPIYKQKLLVTKNKRVIK